MIVLTKRTGIQILVIAGAGLAMTAMLLPSRAQAQETESKSAASNPEAAKPETEQVQTFFLKNVTETRDLNEVTTEMRNVMSRAKIYQVASQNACFRIVRLQAQCRPATARGPVKLPQLRKGSARLA